jgi:hypothetical protein
MPYWLFATPGLLPLRHCYRFLLPFSSFTLAEGDRYFLLEPYAAFSSMYFDIYFSRQPPIFIFAD